MSEERAILINLVMNIDILTVSRNIDDKQLAIDITENEDFNNINFKLAPNNTDGTHTRAQKIIEDIESFFYVYSPYPVEITFTKEDNTQFTLTAIDIMLLRDSFAQILIKNTNIEQTASIKVIYS